MSKKIFQLVNPQSELIRPSSMSKETLETNWESCFFCQETTSEVLECPARKSTHLDKGSGYKSIAEQLKRFQGIGELPSFLDTRTGLSNSHSKNCFLRHFICGMGMSLQHCKLSFLPNFMLVSQLAATILE